MSWADNIHDTYELLQPLLKNAFKELRSMGFIARMNHLCCSSCAGAQIANDIEKMKKEKRKKVQGCVFWHHQDEESFKKRGNIHIRFGTVNTSKYGKIGIDTKLAGYVICKIFDKHDIPYEWDGNPDKCIEVKIPENKIAKASNG